MRGWGVVAGVLVGAALVALLLKALPPVVFIALVVVAGTYGYRRYRLATVVAPQQLEASTLGLERTASDRFGILGYPLGVLARGSNPSVEDVLFGTWRTLDVKLFDLRYAEDGGRERRFSCAVAPLDIEARRMLIEPRTFFTPPEGFMELGEMEVGPAAFRESFEVRGDDPAFAETVLDEGMRTWLLEVPMWGFELSGRWILCYTPRAGARDALGLLQALSTFVDRISGAVHERYRASGPVVSPEDRAGPGAPMMG